jgi:hypothetical protein
MNVKMARNGDGRRRSQMPMSMQLIGGVVG